MYDYKCNDVNRFLLRVMGSVVTVISSSDLCVSVSSWNPPLVNKQQLVFIIAPPHLLSHTHTQVWHKLCQQRTASSILSC